MAIFMRLIPHMEARTARSYAAHSVSFIMNDKRRRRGMEVIALMSLAVPSRRLGRGPSIDAKSRDRSATCVRVFARSEAAAACGAAG